MLLKLANGFATVSYSLLKVKRPIGFEMLYESFEAFLKNVLVSKQNMKHCFVISSFLKPIKTPFRTNPLTRC